jgi:4-amino-4-deoxy-L-arabinose transferase-like glycosyltransferase
LTDREWREASDLRPSRLGLVAVLGIAAVLRFWALGHGIGYSPAVDEPEILDRAVNMMKAGSLAPHFFDYPALYIYLQMFVAIVRFIAGAIGGTWGSLQQANPEAFYLWGRAVTAIFGVATVLLVFQIGMRWGARHALLGAALVAFLPVHVRQSHFILTDVPLTFFVTLTLLLSLRAHEKPAVSAFAWAGAAAGLAAATKYNGAHALVMPLIACWMTRPARGSRTSCALAAVAACGIAYLICAPYTLLDLPGFLDGFAHLANKYRTSIAPPEPAWILYLKYLRGFFGWPALLLMAWGLGLAMIRMIRGPGHVRWMLLVIFPLLYFGFVSGQRIVYGRYLLPILPALCVLTANAVVSGVSLLRRYEIPRAPRTALIAGLTIAALLPPALQAIAFDRMISRQDTVTQAYEWIRTNVPEGSSVAVETRALLLPPAAYRSTNFTRLIWNSPSRSPRELADYVQEGFDYVVASGQVYGPVFDAPQNLPAEYAAYRRLFDQSHEVVRFTPSNEHPGPELRIFRIK